MCVPVVAFLAASAALTAGSTVMTYVAQAEAADAQTAQYKQNKINAEQAYLNDLALMDIRQQQEDAAKMQASFDAKRDTLRARGAATAAADTTQGLSVGELLLDFDRNEAEREQSLLYNRNAGALQGSFDRTGMAIQRDSRINSASRGRSPSVLGSLLTFGGGVMPTVGAFGRYQGWKGFDRLS